MIKKRESVSIDDYMYRLLLSAVIAILTFGTVFYHFVEHWSWLNSYFFSVVTLSTVGYGDLVPQTAIGRFVTTLYIFLGIGIIAVFAQTIVKKREKKIVSRNEKNTER